MDESRSTISGSLKFIINDKLYQKRRDLTFPPRCNMRSFALLGVK